MREKRRLRIYPCQNILHMLKFQDVLESNIMIKGIAIVKSTASKSSCNSFGDSKTYTGEYNEGQECDKSSNDKFVKYAV